MEQRPDPHLKGRVNEGLILQFYQVPFGREAVGKGRQVREVGEGALEQTAVDVWVSVAVDGKGPLLFLPVGDHQYLTGDDLSFPPEHGIVAQQLPDRQAMLGSDGGQSLSGPDHMGLPRVLDD